MLRYLLNQTVWIAIFCLCVVGISAQKAQRKAGGLLALNVLPLMNKTGLGNYNYLSAAIAKAIDDRMKRAFRYKAYNNSRAENHLKRLLRKTGKKWADITKRHLLKLANDRRIDAIIYGEYKTKEGKEGTKLLIRVGIFLSFEYKTYWVTKEIPVDSEIFTTIREVADVVVPKIDQLLIEAPLKGETAQRAGGESGSRKALIRLKKHKKKYKLDQHKTTQAKLTRITSRDRKYFLTIGGFLQNISETKLKQTLEGPATRFRIRRAQFNLFGFALKEKLSFHFELDFAQSNGSARIGDDELFRSFLLDAFASYYPMRGLRLSFGQRATPTDNQEALLKVSGSHFIEPSRLTFAFSSVREFGIFAEGKFEILKGMFLNPGIAITTGDGQSVFQKNLGGLKYGFRLDFLPLGNFSRDDEGKEVDFGRINKPKVSLGLTFSLNNGITSRSGRGAGRILYRDADENFILPNYTKAGVDLLFKYMGLTVLLEYTMASAGIPDNVSEITEKSVDLNRSYDDPDRNYDDSFVQVSGIDPTNGNRSFENISTEEYIKTQLLIGSGLNAQVGYLLPTGISVALRYTLLIPGDFSFLNDPVFYNRPSYYTLTAAKYFAQNTFKIQLSATYVMAEPNTAYGLGPDDIDRKPLDTSGEIYSRLLFQVFF